uniref:CAZy families GT32 protein n=1 Tax=uncultured Catenibacterium sp. TaxID=286142 RepID=A0A060C3N8_9FIRM|nr:CAZy families GT32 protein [uncultured Catenibacterium sp.]
MDIPKVIHYCWFGKGELSSAAQKAIASWEKYAPDFEIRRCDERVFDPGSVAWTKAA